MSKFDKSIIDKMKNCNSDLGKYFRELRNNKGETLHQMSRGTDIDSPMLSKIERGERIPTLEQLKKLSQYFEIEEATLIVMHTAEKIIKEYGINETTYDAIQLVAEQITPYLKKSK